MIEVPKEVYLVFEKRLFVACFSTKKGAERLVAGRKLAGKTGMEIYHYRRKDGKTKPG